MNLNDITANIRLRSPWEAIDLGMSMTQHWWKQLYLPLSIVTITTAALLYLLTPKDSFWIAGLIFWLLKPLYDRVVLHVVSRKLFNQSQNTWQVIKQLPWLLWNTGFFQSISFRRLSLSRGFNLPIWQLEQLRGEKRASRQKVLSQSSQTQAVWLTITSFILEAILFLSLLTLLLFFLPEKQASSFMTGFFSFNEQPKLWAEVVIFIFYVLVVTIVHPIYIASSFALYVNRRTQLEAWDVELDFRKLARRLEDSNDQANASIQKTIKKNTSTKAVFFAFILSSLLISHTATEAEAEVKQTDVTHIEFLSKERIKPERSKELAKETMMVKELNDKKIIKYWVLKDKKNKKKKNKDTTALENFLESIGKIMAFIIEFSLWLLLVLGLILLFVYRNYLLSLFNLRQAENNDEYKAPEVMFGMNIRPDSLPDDILAAFKQKWNDGQHREALSILYRAALIELIIKDQVQLLNSHTENDVLAQAKIKIHDNKYSYLNNLTSAWKEIAYAHRQPEETSIQDLVEHWHSDFTSTSIDVVTQGNEE